MNKYSKNAVIIDGKEVDRSKVCFVPKENPDGFFRTSDGKLYQRQKDGSIRRIKAARHSKQQGAAVH